MAMVMRMGMRIGNKIRAGVLKYAAVHAPEGD